MKSLAAAFTLLACLAVVSCRREDIRTTTIKCPQVTNAPCAKIVTLALAITDGVIPGSIQVTEGRVTVTYDSMKVAIKNLEFAIAEAGFEAGELPANPKARNALPSDCR